MPRAVAVSVASDGRRPASTRSAKMIRRDLSRPVGLGLSGVRVSAALPDNSFGTAGEVASPDLASSDCAKTSGFVVDPDSPVTDLVITWRIAETTTCPETLSPKRDVTTRRDASIARESGRPSSSATTLSTSRLVSGLRGRQPTHAPRRRVVEPAVVLAIR